MCTPSLFYFGLDITEYGHPRRTCFEPVKEYLIKQGHPYARTATILAFMNLANFLMTFGLYRYKECPCCKKKEYAKHLIATEDDTEGAPSSTNHNAHSMAHLESRDSPEDKNANENMEEYVFEMKTIAKERSSYLETKASPSKLPPNRYSTAPAEAITVVKNVQYNIDEDEDEEDGSDEK